MRQLLRIITTLSKNFIVEKGSITLYHGNVYNCSNCEVLELHKPDYVYRQRVDDVLRCWRNNKNDNFDCPRFNFVLDENKASVRFNDIGDRNAPVEYHFELK